MERNEIDALLASQKAYFSSGATLPVNTRKKALERLLHVLDRYEPDLLSALKADLGKSPQEGYMCEIALVKSEIRHMLRHLSAYAKERRVRTPLAQTFSKSFVKPVPYGCVLIMSPWNYPLLLSLDPLVDALAAGNTAIVKPSAYSPATADLIEKMILSCFPSKYVAVIKGGRAENTALLESPLDRKSGSAGMP